MNIFKVTFGLILRGPKTKEEVVKNYSSAICVVRGDAREAIEQIELEYKGKSFGKQKVADVRIEGVELVAEDAIVRS